MGFDLAGRLRNTSLPVTRPLLPIFEAVVNSIHSIQERPDHRGLITVHVERDTTQPKLPFSGDGEPAVQAPIRHCTIHDDGAGFNAANFESFRTSDSQRKISQGGKGVGRLLWLKTFSGVEIQSTYKEARQWRSRSFNFSLPVGITDHREGPEADKEAQRFYTEVSLRDVKPEIQNALPKRLRTLAVHIIEHCLLYFMRPHMPHISVSDGEESEDLNELFAEFYRDHAIDEHLKICGVTFPIRHVRLYSAEEKDHRLHLCANEREVTSEKLERHIPNLANKLRDREGRPFVWSTFLSGDCLDEYVDSERRRFNLPEDEDEATLYPDVPSLKSIRAAAIKNIRKHLGPYVDPLNDEKWTRVRTYVRAHPRFRPVLKEGKDALEDIPPNVDDADLEGHLSRILFAIEEKLRALGRSLHRPLADAESFKKFEAKFTAYMDGVTDLGVQRAT